MGAHVLLSLAINSKSERKSCLTDPPLRLEPASFDTPEHLSDRSAKSHETINIWNKMILLVEKQNIKRK
jgi:hypothetical protein